MQEISTDVGESTLPFSEAIKHGDTIYVSGQGPIDPETGEVAVSEIEAQTIRTLRNVERILAAGGSSLDDIVKATLYLDDMSDYDAINSAYRKTLSEPYPARTAVEVVDHPVDIGIEIDVIAASK